MNRVYEAKHHWTQSDLDFLQQNHQKLTYKEIGEKLRKTAKAVKCKVLSAGLATPRTKTSRTSPDSAECSTQRAAELTGLSPAAITAYCRAGKFQNARKVQAETGEKWTIPLAEVEKIIKLQRQRRTKRERRDPISVPPPPLMRTLLVSLGAHKANLILSSFGLPMPDAHELDEIRISITT